MGGSIQDSLLRLEGKLDLAVKDLGELKARIAEIGAPDTQTELILAGVSARLDQVDERLHRLERRIDLVIIEIETETAHLETRQ